MLIYGKDFCIQKVSGARSVRRIELQMVWLSRRSQTLAIYHLERTMLQTIKSLTRQLLMIYHITIAVITEIGTVILLLSAKNKYEAVRKLWNKSATQKHLSTAWWRMMSRKMDRSDLTNMLISNFVFLYKGLPSNIKFFLFAHALDTRHPYLHLPFWSLCKVATMDYIYST